MIKSTTSLLFRIKKKRVTMALWFLRIFECLENQVHICDTQDLKKTKSLEVL